ncbi:MAG: glycosyltransferase [Anaerolineales bacterium]
MTAVVALTRQLIAPGAPLVLYSWQNLARPRSFWVRALSGLTLRAATHFVCGNTEAVQLLRSAGYARGADVAPMMGVDTRLFRPHSAQALSMRLGLSSFTVGYVGRLSAEKGVTVLLEALALARQPMQAMIVGDGPMATALQARAQSLGLADRCRFVGAADYAAVPEYINAMDTLVLPSLTTAHWKEQFGRVLIEAMGCRVPVIGSASGAIPEVIGDAGRIFPEGDALALAAVLDELELQPRLRAELAERGYTRVQARYTVEQLAATLLGVWRRLSTIEGR